MTSPHTHAQTHSESACPQQNWVFHLLGLQVDRPTRRTADTPDVQRDPTNLGFTNQSWTHPAAVRVVQAVKLCLSDWLHQLWRPRAAGYSALYKRLYTAQFCATTYCICDHIWQIQGSLTCFFRPYPKAFFSEWSFLKYCDLGFKFYFIQTWHKDLYSTFRFRFYIKI